MAGSPADRRPQPGIAPAALRRRVGWNRPGPGLRPASALAWLGAVAGQVPARPAAGRFRGKVRSFALLPERGTPMSAFTVELDNQPGQLARLCEAMASGGVNLLLCATASGDRGVAAFIADDEATAQAVL